VLSIARETWCRSSRAIIKLLDRDRCNRHGFALHDRGRALQHGCNFTKCAGGKEEAVAYDHSAFAQKGDVRVAFGIMGGWNQSQAHAQFVANLVDFKMNIQAGLEAPRFSKQTFSGCDVMMENRFGQNVAERIDDKGHKIEVKGTFSSGMGGGKRL